MGRNSWYRKSCSGDLVECAPTVNYIDYLNRIQYGEVEDGGDGDDKCDGLKVHRDCQ